MPTSEFEPISKIVRIVSGLNPKSIMEIGPGFGKYGHLFREYLEFWDESENKNYNNFQRVINCCEAFEGYITPVHKYIYNKIIIDNAKNSAIENYDLVTLIDVLEHFTVAEAKDLLTKLIKANKYVLISVPIMVGKQEDAFTNEFERHKSQFEYKFFKNFKYVRFFASEQLLCIISNQKIKSAYSFKAKLKALALSIGDFIPEIYYLLRSKQLKITTKDIQY